MRPPRYEERRSFKDRRSKPTSPFTLASLRGRRRQVRREEDASVHRYVDLYDWDIVSLILLILLLSLSDAFLTLLLIEMGSSEINPVMAFFLEFGPLHFVLSKYALTALGSIWLLIHKNFQFFNRTLTVRSVLVYILFLYSCLIVYELSLIF
jgi:hypothetical protein